MNNQPYPGGTPNYSSTYYGGQQPYAQPEQQAQMEYGVPANQLPGQPPYYYAPYPQPQVPPAVSWQQPQQPSFFEHNAADPKASMALAGMILGVASVGVILTFYGTVLSPFIAIGGIICSAIGCNSITKSGLAKGGLAVSITGLLLSILMMAAWFLFFYSIFHI